MTFIQLEARIIQKKKKTLSQQLNKKQKQYKLFKKNAKTTKLT
jgi:hypothetical protein